MATLNLVLQTLHNLIRWAVVIFGLIAILRAFYGWRGRKTFTSADTKAGVFYTMTFDIQILLGIILYFTKGWFGVLSADFAAAMSSGTRFFAIEHLGLMFIAVIAAHIGRGQSRNIAESVQKHRRAALWYGLSFILMLAAVPWPFTTAARPWLRLFSFTF